MKQDGDYTPETDVHDDLSYKQTPWACARQRRGLDSEALVQLRVNLNESFGQARNWPSLRSLLQQKGFDMRPRAGRLRLVDLQSQVEICTFGKLGHPRLELERRFGSLPNAH